MRELVKVVLDYVKEEKTKYAVFINGAWGAGKTYYWDTVLKPAIEGQRILEPIYISLYGEKSLESVSEKIFFASKKIEYIDADSARSITSGVEKLIGIFSKLPFKVNVKVPYDKFVNYNKYIICFDDLERTHIEIKEVIGYITNLVERKNTKIIIIGCEQELEKFFIHTNLEAKMATAIASLKEEERGNIKAVHDRMKQLFCDFNVFRSIKEKLVGKTIEYIPDYKNIIDSIICAYKEPYKQFLEENRELIFNAFIESKTNNLRILKYSLSDFAKVYDFIQSKNLTDKGVITSEILVFQLASSFEILNGKYTKTEIESYRSNEYVIMQMKDLEQEAIGQESGGKSLVPFFQKYYSDTVNNKYKFFPSLWDYISQGILNEEYFLEDVSNVYYKKGLQDKDSVDKFIDGFWKLPEDDFQCIWPDALSLIEQGKTELKNYPQMFWHFEGLINNNAIPMDLETLKDKFKHGLDIIAKSDQKVSNDVGDYFVYNKVLSPDFTEIRDYVFNVNNKLTERDLYSEISKLREALSTGANFSALLDSEEYRHIPIFKYLKVDELSNYSNMCTNGEIVDLRNVVTVRYRYDNVRDFLSEDYETLYQFSKYLESVIKGTNGYSLRNFVLGLLLNNLTAILKRLKK